MLILLKLITIFTFYTIYIFSKGFKPQTWYHIRLILLFSKIIKITIHIFIDNIINHLTQFKGIEFILDNKLSYLFNKNFKIFID